MAFIIVEKTKYEKYFEYAFIKDTFIKHCDDNFIVNNYFLFTRNSLSAKELKSLHEIRRTLLWLQHHGVISDTEQVKLAQLNWFLLKKELKSEAA